MKAKCLIWSFVFSLVIPFNYVPILSACTIFNATEGSWTLAASNEDYVWNNAFIRYVEPTVDYYGTMAFLNPNSPQIGMNDQGLFYDLNALPETGWTADPNKQDYGGRLASKILGECTTVDEVIAMYAQYNEPRFRNVQFHWADATGASIVATYDPNAGQDGYLAKTGHFQVSTNFNVLTSTGPCWRYDRATDLLANSRNISVALMSHVCSEVRQEAWTLFSCIFDTATGDAYVHCHYPSIDFNNVALLNVDDELAKGSRDVFLTSLTYVPKNDVFPPAATVFSPANSAIAVRLNGTLSLTFTEIVNAGAGNITIKQYSDDTTFEIIDVNNVGGLGTTTITIDPVQWFSTDTQYYVLIDDTALMDEQGDFYHGIPVKTSWSFTTTASGPEGDPPAISSIVAGGNPWRVKVIFNEPILKAPAGVSTNYEISSGVTVNSAVVGLDNQTVTLATTMLSEGTYTLTINNIEDYWSNVVLADTQETFTHTDILHAHWKLDEAEGTVAHDSAGTYDANLIGDPVWRPDGGQVGGALELDGVDDGIQSDLVLDPVGQDLHGPFSVFVWVKGGGPNQVIISQALGDNWLMADASGNLKTEAKKQTTWASMPLSSDALITDGQWHHVGLVWDADAGIRSLYVDEIEVATDQPRCLSGHYWDAGFHIGAPKRLNFPDYWSGLIDDVRVYDRAVKP